MQLDGRCGRRSEGGKENRGMNKRSRRGGKEEKEEEEVKWRWIVQEMTRQNCNLKCYLYSVEYI
jgi:hypothetical protein